MIILLAKLQHSSVLYYVCFGAVVVQQGVSLPEVRGG